MIFAQSERLLLRRARDDDLEPLIETWSDPVITRYTSRRSDVRGFLTQMVADMQAKLPGEIEPGGPWYQFIIERREDGLAIGDVGVGFDIPGERQVELGYRLKLDCQRRGYAREAVAAIIDYLIESHAIHRFVAVAAVPNVASIALLRSLGFRREGVFRQSFLCDGEWLDDEYHALLASEWAERRNA
jgi:RimJ/RimL family protein N-acetyltransferase